MIYPVALKSVGLIVGLALIGAHLFAVLRPADCRRWLKEFPRSRVAGTILIALAAVWSFFLVQSMDLGEFGRLRTVMLVAIVAGAFLAWRYVEEFLAVRALGMLALLAAEPILEATFLRGETSRLLLVVLAYAWILAGLFWVGLPWLLRDQIAWLVSREARYRAAAWGGLVYGILVLGSAAAIWK